MSDLTPFFSPHEPDQNSPEPPRKKTIGRRVAIGVTCGIIGLGLLGTTAAFAVQGGPADLQAVAATIAPTASPTPGVVPDGATPPADAPDLGAGTGGDCGPGGTAPGGEGPIAGGPEGGAAPDGPPVGENGAPTPPTGAPTPPTDAPAPPTDAPAPPTDAPAPPADGGTGS